MGKTVLLITLNLLIILAFSQEKQKVIFNSEEGILRKEDSNIQYWLRCPDNPWEYCEYTLLLEKGSYTFIPIKHNRQRVLFTVDEKGEVYIRYTDNNLQFKIIK